MQKSFDGTQLLFANLIKDILDYYIKYIEKRHLMNITFLIGNGFDVGVGLKSKFKDFFPIYKILSENKDEEIKKFSEDINKDIDTWSDFESALGDYTVQFTTKTKQVFINRLKDFELEFIDYLKEQEEGLVFPNEIGMKFKKALVDYYCTEVLNPESSTKINDIYQSTSNQAHTYNFINNNYTNVLEKCVSKIPQRIVTKHKFNSREINDRIGKIIHIHGKIGLQPIIGVNDSSQIKNKELASDARFCKYLVKPTINATLGQKNASSATELINNSRIICIYGMALGSTDKIWWQTILSWLCNNTSRQLVIFVYDESYTTNTPFEFIEKQDEIIDKLSLFCPSNIQLNSLISRIHIAIHKNIFSFQTINVYEEAFNKLSNKSVEESA